MNTSGHLALEDADGALQRVDDVDELLLVRREVRGLLWKCQNGGKKQMGPIEICSVASRLPSIICSC